METIALTAMPLTRTGKQRKEREKKREKKREKNISRWWQRLENEEGKKYSSHVQK
jgi:hypothetical protein